MYNHRPIPTHQQQHTSSQYIFSSHIGIVSCSNSKRGTRRIMSEHNFFLLFLNKFMKCW
jgi:hypothetical protein